MKDKMVILNLIGCLVKKPEILLDSKYVINENDFPEKFHIIVFSAINNLALNGAKELNPIEIDKYLVQFPSQYNIFTKNKGIEFIEKSKKISEINNFDFYYNSFMKIKAMNELSQYCNTDLIFDENETDFELREQMQQKFNSLSVEELIDTFINPLTLIKDKYSSNSSVKKIQAGEGLRELKEKYKKVPEMGMPTASPVMNRVYRGRRLKKFYLMSLPTGLGKSRISVGDICVLAIGKYYDWGINKWIDTGVQEPSLFITTELEKEEIQSMLLANISGVNETIILDGKYESKHQEEVVDQAITFVEESPFWIEEQPNFTIDTIKNCIRRNKIEHGIGYVFYDYIYMSVEMLIDMATKSKGVKLREDNILYMFSNAMKSLANELNLHIASSTQLNGDWENSKMPNQNLLRGAKAIADKLDVGVIGLEPTESELEAVQPILSRLEGFLPQPNLVYHVYKLRKGKFNNIKVWIYFDYGTCRTTDLFVTDKKYKLLEVEAIEIEKLLEMTEENEDNIKEESEESLGSKDSVYYANVEDFIDTDDDDFDF